MKKTTKQTNSISEEYGNVEPENTLEKSINQEEMDAFLNRPIDFNYNMQHKKRGACLIFNHKHCDGWNTRKGTSIDRKRLQKTFRSLNFKVVTHNDRTKSQILNEILPEGVFIWLFFLPIYSNINFRININYLFCILIEVAKADHSDADCLVITLLTHGELAEEVDDENKTILSHELVCSVVAKDKSYPVHEIFQQFTDRKCPTLANKPKLFFIQACQGERLDFGLSIQTDEVDALCAFNGRRLNIFRPQKDFLIVYSSVPGFQSFRNEENGSWFVQALCDELDKSKYTDDLLKILTIVSQAVAYDKESSNKDNENLKGKKQVPCVASMLTKRILFKEKDQD